eukprot:TRINITY_DN70807_c3_g1_i1.p2 TRINITY_DN70807_c3_g1~~TRINITY_DN70807_c3_g1_i1.p2  ORF type:complete len:490 (-),score=95.15 TRINITY_DN70807_c3_g1_i1:9691-11160(-)
MLHKDQQRILMQEGFLKLVLSQKVEFYYYKAEIDEPISMRKPIVEVPEGESEPADAAEPGQELSQQEPKEEEEELRDTVNEISKENTVKATKRRDHVLLKSDIAGDVYGEKEDDVTISQVTIMNPEASKASKPAESQRSDQLSQKPRAESKRIGKATKKKEEGKSKEESKVGSQEPISQQNPKTGLTSLLSGFSKIEVEEGKDKKHETKPPKEEKIASIKPTKLKFSEERPKKPREEKIPKKSPPPVKRKQKSENGEKPAAKKKEAPEKRKRNTEAPSTKDFFKQYVIKLDDEELNVSSEQRKIVDLFQVSYRRPKGNRALILDRELALLKQIPMKYKEVELPVETNPEDLDTCPHLGEKVQEIEDGYVWKQVDIAAMKAEKKALAAMRKERKITAQGGITLSIEGEEKQIGDKHVHKRNPIADMDDGKVKLLYHGQDGPLNIYVLDITKGGEFVHQLGGEKMVMIWFINKGIVYTRDKRVKRMRGHDR